MQKDFLGRKILVITAHPDDESYVSAGTIYKNFQKGGWTVLICGSYGERGTSHMKKIPAVPTMKKIRHAELLQASKVLHIAPVHILGLPDGHLNKHLSNFFKKSVALAKRYAPQVVISFGPDGISGHHDHIAAGKVARQVAQTLRLPFYSFTLPPAVATNALTWLKHRRKASHYANTIHFKKPSLKIPINRQVKLRALRSHVSQMDNKNAFTGFPPFAVQALLKTEYFVREK